jgi:glycosyltransferase involved in cell wall biosynthesis
MKVAIDVSSFYYSRRGVSRYIQCLISELNALNPSELELIEIAYRIQNFAYSQPFRAIKTAGRELLWGPHVVPLLVKQLKADLLHSPSDGCIRSSRHIPKIATLHDLEQFYTPERFRWWTRKRFSARLEFYKSAQRMICVSKSTADDAIKFLNYPAKQIDVIHLGSHFSINSSEECPTTPPFSEYFLFVSALEPGKNLQLLNKAYKIAESKGIILPPLLIAGERVKNVSNEGEPPKSWRYLGRISDASLVWLYRRALALLAPTKYEGFGLPILEAMTLGTPIICSPVSSLPEVGGDVPFYARQTPESYLEQILVVLRNPQLRDERVKAGLSRSKLFSWKKCAAETMEVYKSILR